VARHSDEAEDRKLIGKMVDKKALTGKAKGGKAKAKVSARPVPAPTTGGVPGGGRPPVPVVAGQPSVGLGAMMAKGGKPKTRRAAGGPVKHKMTAGAESGIGRLQKIGRNP
jgi:hypothetical protein